MEENSRAKDVHRCTRNLSQGDNAHAGYRQARRYSGQPRPLHMAKGSLASWPASDGVHPPIPWRALSTGTTSSTGFTAIPFILERVGKQPVCSLLTVGNKPQQESFSSNQETPHQQLVSTLFPKELVESATTHGRHSTLAPSTVPTTIARL